MIETKIFIALTYYTIVGAVTLADFALTTINRDALVTEYEKHFICEAKGSGSPCDKSKLEHNSTGWLELMTFALLSLLPVANLVFIISWKDVKHFLQSKFRKITLLKEKNGC